jgi:hypothetical protein
MSKFVPLIALAFALSLPSAGFAAEVSDADSVALQASMQSQIDRNLVDGAVLSLDPVTGDVSKLYPAKAHPKIMTFGDKYVLCADFMDETGNMVMGNFYMARAGDHFVVFDATYGPDSLLERLMADGKVAMAN